MNECKDCGIRIRKNRESVADVPGSRRSGGQGLCAVCRVHMGKEPAEAVSLSVDERRAAVALECYLVERRKRLGRWAA